ncbi:MAG: discoidin domain-containing protein [Phycisphaerae bacterium]|nr:discoidin domain-containing protein [Phycisphaerae bacterium]
MCKRMVMLFFVGWSIALVGVSAQADLIAHWPMDEGAGAIVADVSGGYDGSIEGNVVWTEGKIGSALKFPGVQGNNVNVGNVAINIGSNFTLACWIKISEVSSFHDILAKGPKDPGHYELYLNGSGTGGGGRLKGGAAAYIPDLGDFWSSIKVDDDTWHHIAWTYDGTTVTCYVDGGDTGIKTWAVPGRSVVAESEEFRIGSLASSANPFGGTIDDVRIYDTALPAEEIQQAMKGVPPGRPNPADAATDMPRDIVLSWTRGEFANTHDVYFGTVFDDVNDADTANPLDVLVSPGQSAMTYVPDRLLEFGQTYYWRVDEVNVPPDNTVFKGEVWSFTVEPFVYPITGIAASSNGVSEAGVGPERTVDGSGLDATAGQHSTLDTDMWLAASVEGEPLWIQYEFGRVYKLRQMNVWNYNISAEEIVGFGLKDVRIEYSTDAVEWTTLGSVELAQAAGNFAEKGMIVDLGGVAAKYVRFNVDSAWGTLGQYGLSEVQFQQIPTFAREPQPADGESDVSIDPALSWRVGREAVTHQAHFGMDETKVAQGDAMVDVVTENRYEPGQLNVGTTYYWRVDEVNEAEAVSTWQGDLWSFTTQESLIVDDFESYEDTEPSRIFDVWPDGWKDDTNGSVVGNSEVPFAEQVIVHGGGQSMNLAYDNSAAKVSEAARTWATAQNWTANGVEVLRIWHQGAQAPGSISYDAAGGTYTLRSAGPDIWGTADGFHFAYKELVGNGSITARVDGITDGGVWAKVGVMVRESLEPGATHAMMAVTPANRVSFVHRLAANEGTSDANGDADAFAMPHWVRITREGNILRGEHSSDGVNWTGPTADPAQTEVGAFLPQTVYVGLAMSSFKPGQFAEATFTNVQTTGNVAGGTLTTSQDIGIASNTPELLYVTLQDLAGNSAAVSHEDGFEAVNAPYWKAWDISLDKFAADGVNLTGVKKMYIGVGDRNAAPSGAVGVLYFDDIQLRGSMVADAEPVLHLDASALALQDGDPVVDWGGVSAAGTPVFLQSQTPGGGPAVLFDGSAHFGQVTLPSSSAGDFILVAVISPENLNAYHNIVDDDAAQRPMLWVDNRSPNTYEANFSPTGAIAAEAGSTGTEKWDILIWDSRSGVFYLNSPTVTHYINAVPWSPGAGSQGFSLFNRGGDAAFQGRVAEFRIYNDAAAFGMDFDGLYQELFDKWFAGEGQ